MDKIKRNLYRDSMRRFIRSELCCYNTKFSDAFLDDVFSMSNYHWFPTFFLTVYNKKIKTTNRPQKGMYLASGFVLMFIAISVTDNLEYFKSKYEPEAIDKILEEVMITMPAIIGQNEDALRSDMIYQELAYSSDPCVLERRKRMKEAESNFVERLTVMVTDYLQDKKKMLVGIVEKPEFTMVSRAKKTDLLQYGFKTCNPEALCRNLQVVDQEEMMEYVKKKYGAIGEMASMFAWHMGSDVFGEQTSKETDKILSSLGTSFGIMMKISNDFDNLERDLKLARSISTNLVVNYGINECYNIYLEHHTNLFALCETLDIYKTTIKEMIEKMNEIIDENIANSDIELRSRYSAFSSKSGLSSRVK